MMDSIQSYPSSKIKTSINHSKKKHESRKTSCVQTKNLVLNEYNSKKTIKTKNLKQQKRSEKRKRGN